MGRVKSVRIELNRKGVVDILLSAQVQQDLTDRARRIQNAAGDGFDVDVTENRDRSVVFVTTATQAAREAEAEARALTRAIDAGR